MNNPMPWEDPRLQEILSLLQEIQTDAPPETAAETVDVSDDPLDQLLAQVKSIHKHHTELDRSYGGIEERLSEATEAIMAIARLDFTYKAPVTERGDLIDAVSLGLNMLGEELHAKYVSSSYFDNIIHSMLDTLVVVTPDALIKLTNTAALELLGYEDYELVGRPMERLFLPEHYNDIARRLQSDSVLGGVEEVYVTKSGIEVPVLLSAALMHDEAGKVEGIVFVAQDITERKAAKVALERARDAAEMAARAKSQFLANMSHEIRTPLNGIIGMANLLQDTELSDVQQEKAETILRSSDSLLDIINNILDFSKVEAGKIDLEQQPFILNDCIEECLDLIAPKAAQKQLEIVYEIYSESNQKPVSTLIGDVTRIRQIIVNLLGNAVKFTEQGEIVVRATVQKALEKKVTQSEEEYELCISVQDSGIGIPAERLDTVFDSFNQADISTTRRYGGTGLGLSICKLLCETMNGHIWAESIEGRGSTFFCVVSVATSADQGGEPHQLYNQSKLLGKSLLIVDDNLTVRRTLVGYARKWQMSVQTAASGNEALELLGSGEHFDICLLDAAMPSMNGYALINAIRQNDLYSHMRIVLLKSLADLDVPEIQPVITATVTKPVKVRLLAAALVDAATQKTQTRKPTTSHRKVDVHIASKYPLRILLAEDNIVNQKVALLMLKRLGYNADVAANGCEALDALARQSYDVVLMDIQMPEMDGLQATKRILADWSSQKRPRIIAMTANALKGDRERYLAEGMDDYVAKPIRAEDLVSALKQVRPLPRTGTHHPVE